MCSTVGYKHPCILSTGHPFLAGNTIPATKSVRAAHLRSYTVFPPSSGFVVSKVGRECEKVLQAQEWLAPCQQGSTGKTGTGHPGDKGRTRSRRARMDKEGHGINSKLEQNQRKYWTQILFRSPQAPNLSSTGMVNAWAAVLLAVRLYPMATR